MKEHYAISASEFEAIIETAFYDQNACHLPQIRFYWKLSEREEPYRFEILENTGRTYLVSVYEQVGLPPTFTYKISL